MKLKRAISLQELNSKVYKDLVLDEPWSHSLGEPELAGVWFVYGDSGNGKTSFCLQLGKYLTKHGKVAYDSLEQGDSKSFKMAINRENMMEVKNRFMILNREPFDELFKRLRRHKSADIIFIDTIQYLSDGEGKMFNYSDYRSMKNEFKNKLFVIVSQTEGNVPRGSTARSIRFDADVKIIVKGFKAEFNSRFGGNQDYIINHEKYTEFYCTV